jgi:hypothetical protein
MVKFNGNAELLGAIVSLYAGAGGSSEKYNGTGRIRYSSEELGKISTLTLKGGNDLAEVSWKEKKP